MAQPPEPTPVQQEEDRTGKCAPATPLQSPVSISSTAQSRSPCGKPSGRPQNLPLTDKEAVQGPDSSKEDGSIINFCEMSWCFRQTVVTEERVFDWCWMPVHYCFKLGQCSKPMVMVTQEEVTDENVSVFILKSVLLLLLMTMCY